MKKTIALLLVLFFALLITSCGRAENMAGLLAYQNGDFRATLSSDGGGKLIIEKSGGETKISVGSACYTPKGEGAVLNVCGLETELLRLPPDIRSALGAFCFDTDVVWKIERSTVGGADVYICSSEEGKIYILKDSHLPCRAEKDGKIFDITSFEVIKKAPTE